MTSDYYSPLTIKWTLPIPHENKIYSTKVYEIFYTRILVYLFLSMIFTIVILNFWSDFYLGIIILLLLIVFFLLFPVFFIPWDIVLSNKRLVLRSKRFYNIGRFSRIINYNLIYLETQTVTPRIKVTSLLIGFIILQSFSFSLIDYGFTENLPVPFIVALFFLIGGITGITKQIQSDIANVTQLIFKPFFDFALLAGIISLILAISLIAFSLPYRKIMMLQTTGGHTLTINNAGFPEELTTLLYAVGRKHRTQSKDASGFSWDIPLLEDEVVLSVGKVGLINRRTQLLGFLSMILLFQSLGYLFKFFIEPTVPNGILLGLFVLNFFMIIFAIIFSKRYYRIIATNHRLLFQVERNAISGLWGKRIYEYSDLQKQHLQGFSVSRFTGISSSSLIFAGILVLMIIVVVNRTQSLIIFYLLLLIFFSFLLFNYKAYTRLEFRSFSGFGHILNYNLPLVLEKIAHRIENYDRVYNLLYPNILTNEDIIRLCNNIRDIKNPVSIVDHQTKERISENAFFDKHEISIKSWEKLGPAPFIITSIVLGSLLALGAIFLIIPFIDESISSSFTVISVIITLIIGFRSIIIFKYTLIINKGRVFFIKQKLPRKLAQLFGVLPQWTMDEVDKEQILSAQFKYKIPPSFLSFLFSFGFLSLNIFFLFNQNIFIENLPFEVTKIIIFLIGILIILFIPITIRTLIALIPRYSLTIYTRFGIFILPYATNLKNIQNDLREQPHMDQFSRIQHQKDSGTHHLSERK